MQGPYMSCIQTRPHVTSIDRTGELQDLVQRTADAWHARFLSVPSLVSRLSLHMWCGILLVKVNGDQQALSRPDNYTAKVITGPSAGDLHSIIF